MANKELRGLMENFDEHADQEVSEVKSDAGLVETQCWSGKLLAVFASNKPERVA